MGPIDCRGTFNLASHSPFRQIHSTSDVPDKYPSFFGWIDEGKQFVAGEYKFSEGVLSDTTDIKVYNVTDGSNSPYEGPKLIPFFVRSMTGKFAFCGDGFVGLLDITDGKQTELLALPEGEGCLVQLAWSPDGNYVILGVGKHAEFPAREPYKLQVVNIETKEVTLIKKDDDLDLLSRIRGLDWIAAAP